MLQMDYEPEGVAETLGDTVGAVLLRVSGDLERFKDSIEAQGRESSAWRGEVKGKETRERGLLSIRDGRPSPCQ